ncbi:MAG: hypothetical protein CMH56_09275 [Myxococcales bacterium]|nr:hypothetical protein [Myxococcales bacterium]
MIQKTFAALGFFSFSFMVSQPAAAFCGFYVAKAEASLFNNASQVVLARHDNKTVITMSNDYQGELTEFAMVVPVPEVLKKEQIHIANQKDIDHLDAYTAPRLVEYFDKNPCNPPPLYEQRALIGGGAKTKESAPLPRSAKQLGVTIEASYTVGEYDILILSAKESGGLVTWLEANDYKIPKNAGDVLESYIKQDTKFFVAKVNLEEQAKAGFTKLRPLSMAFETPKFMLPIRLGTVNANGPQDLIIYTLSPKGRVETTNYRTVKLPTGQELPPYIKTEFKPFYKDMFATSVNKEDMKAVFLEYAWDMSWCDPCAADPLSKKQLVELGAFWELAKETNTPPNRRVRLGNNLKTYVTRLHVRYTGEKFPDDLRFQDTGNRENFQSRYVLRHPYGGNDECAAMDNYRKRVQDRREKEMVTLAGLTGWDMDTIRPKGKLPFKPVDTPKPNPQLPWYKRIWGD